MSTVHQSPPVVQLTLTIGGVPYDLEPVHAGECGTRAWRLAKADGAIYDVIHTHDGILECDCAHYTYRLKGNTPQPCKHGLALVTAGLMPAPAPRLRRQPATGYAPLPTDDFDGFVVPSDAEMRRDTRAAYERA